MTLIRCYNCQGWSCGKGFLNHNIDSFDLSFLHQYGLLDNQISTIHHDFVIVACYIGHPFDGCSIVYGKSLSPCITPISPFSDHFCDISFCDSSDKLFPLCCVYLPNESQPSYTDFLNVLGELHGPIPSDACHGVFLVGDFQRFLTLQPKW